MTYDADNPESRWPSVLLLCERPGGTGACPRRRRRCVCQVLARPRPPAGQSRIRPAWAISPSASRRRASGASR